MDSAITGLGQTAASAQGINDSSTPLSRHLGCSERPRPVALKEHDPAIETSLYPVYDLSARGRRSLTAADYFLVGGNARMDAIGRQHRGRGDPLGRNLAAGKPDSNPIL
jgi:hypothetical protein